MSTIHRVLEQLEVVIDPQLFELAVTHRSFAYENGGLPTNERLEFLGDSVLGVVVTEHLFRTHTELSEGRLAKLRAAVVNARALAGVARGLDVGPHIRLGRGELNSGGHDKSSILADTMEALIGAVHLVHGLDGSARLVHHLFDPLMIEAANLGAGLDWKTSVQELAAGAGLGIPGYAITESGPDHAKHFEAWLVIGEERFGPGEGRNKKQAEQEAAATAFRELEVRLAGPAGSGVVAGAALAAGLDGSATAVAGAAAAGSTTEGAGPTDGTAADPTDGAGAADGIASAAVDGLIPGTDDGSVPAADGSTPTDGPAAATVGSRTGTTATGTTAPAGRDGSGAPPADADA